MNEKTINIKKLINNYTIETTPKVYEKIGNLKDLLMPNTCVDEVWIIDMNIDF